MVCEQLNIFEVSKEAEISQESHLTPRQWSLYRLIKFNSLVNHRKTTQREIYDSVGGYEWNNDEKAHDHCPAIWNDVKDNNISLEHDKIIISKNFEYWIGSEEETKQFLNDLWKALAPRLKRYWLYVKKIGMDGKGKLFDKNGNQNQLTNFYECFNDYDISMGGDK